MKNLVSIAADLGASGGKMAKGNFDGDKLFISDFYDFDNRPVNIQSALYWDVFGLYGSITDGIAKYAVGNEIKSIAVDAWGASYGLLDARGRLLEPVYHYRDERTLNTVENIYKIVDEKKVFQMTGCQCNRTYTLPQLYSYKEQQSKVLESASQMLFLPDLLSYFLSGEISTEMTIAGTSALMNRDQENWCYELFEKLELPTHLLTRIVEAKTIKGSLLKTVGEKTGAKDAKVIATVSHDSASAVAAIPGFGLHKLYVSVGTNISMGVESQESIVTDAAYTSGFKNTGGIDKRKIVYRDFAAFWLINELRKAWKMEGTDYSFQDLIQLGSRTRSREVYFDLEEPQFNNVGGDMRHKINEYLERTGQEQLETNGEYVLCVLESIAMKVKYYAELLKTQLNVLYTDVFVINGGTRNPLLMQMFSNALGVEIKAGMPYATLAGNILTQLYALGKVKSVDEIRELSKQSFAMKSYEPQESFLYNIKCNRG